MNTKRILLVGKDKNSSGDLMKLQAVLSDGWEISTTDNGNDALTAMDKTPFDIIVTEMQIPGISGVELLKETSERHPSTVRYMVSEQGDKTAIIQSAGYVHQLVPSPVNPQDFRKLLENSLGLRRLLSDQTLCDRVAAIRSLPSPPDLYTKLVTELKSDTASIAEIADLIGNNIGIAAKLLQMVNSAYFGIPNRVDNISHAINLLGLDTVQSLVLSAGVFSQFEDPKLPGFSIDSIYDRSTIVGAKSRLLAHAFGLNRRITEDALLAGMLHDIGKLLMLTSFQSELREALSLAGTKSIPLYQAEYEIMGVSDAAIGAYLLSLWGLPDSILEAVALHYMPREIPNPLLNATTAVHVAYATDLDENNNVKKDEDSAADIDYLQKIGIADQLPNFRYFCTGAVV